MLIVSGCLAGVLSGLYLVRCWYAYEAYTHYHHGNAFLEPPKEFIFYLQPCLDGEPHFHLVGADEGGLRGEFVCMHWLHNSMAISKTQVIGPPCVIGAARTNGVEVKWVPFNEVFRF